MWQTRVIVPYLFIIRREVTLLINIPNLSADIKHEYEITLIRSDIE